MGFINKRLENISMPNWVKIRPGWRYVGWISKVPAVSTFEQLVEGTQRSDHGELREVDIYPEGAACWMLEANHDLNTNS